MNRQKPFYWYNKDGKIHFQPCFDQSFREYMRGRYLTQPMSWHKIGDKFHDKMVTQIYKRGGFPFRRHEKLAVPYRLASNLKEKRVRINKVGSSFL